MVEGPPRRDDPARRPARALGRRHGRGCGRGVRASPLPPDPLHRDRGRPCAAAAARLRRRRDRQAAARRRRAPDGARRDLRPVARRPRARRRRDGAPGGPVPRPAGGLLMPPVTRYAPSGDVSIAYQVVGEGPLDLMFVPGWVSQVEQLWESAALRRFLERLGAFSRLILFDRRGTGLSDRTAGEHSLEQDVGDALAVLDAAGSERTALLAYGLGGPAGILLAAGHPDRIGALITFGSVARTAWAPDYDWALTIEERRALMEQTVERWGQTDSEALAVL